MTNFSELTDEHLNILSELAAGNGDPLASYLEAGGDLTKDQRAVLIRYLRRELILKRGNRRTFSQDRRVQTIREQLQALQWRFAFEFGSRGSYRRALEAYHAMNPTIEYETLRSYAKRGLLPKAHLDAIDRAREDASKE